MSVKTHNGNKTISFKTYAVRRGVSPIVAILLLMIIVVAAAALTYAFVSGFFSGTPENQPIGSMVIESYSIPAGSDSIVVYVRNSGSKTLNITSMYVDGQPVALNPKIAAPGEVLRFVVPLPDSINATGSSMHSLRFVASDHTLVELTFHLSVPSTPLDYTHEPVLIEGDQGFKNSDSIVIGSGTAGDPYVIKDLVINANGSIGITASGTNSHFKVVNCTIFNGDKGVYISGASNIMIENCNFSNNVYGIFLSGASNVVIENSSIGDNAWCGIYVYGSTNVTILDSSVINNYYGIYSSSSRNVGMHYSRIYGNLYDILNLELDHEFQINATYCYWGYSEPDAASIGDNVLFDPWLSYP